MTTRQRGDAAEAAILAGLTRAGLAVWTPWSSFGPCDLMVESPVGRVLRVQVKHGRVRDGCVIAKSRGTDHGRGRQTYIGVVDVLAIHAAELNTSYVVPVDLAPGFEIRLRLTPTRNGQRKRVIHAGDHLLEDWAARFTAGVESLAA